MNRNQIILIFLSLITCIACQKSKFKVKTFLPELYDFKIEPELTTLNSEITSLTTEFSDIKTEITDLNIESFRDKYKPFLANVESVNFYNLGDISAIYVFSRFYKSKMDTTKLWSFYNSQPSFHQEDIAAQINSIKGITSIEYLLFNPQAKDSLLGSDKYVNFLHAQLQSAELELENIVFSWSVYKSNFVALNEKGIDGSYNIVVNRIVHGFEEIIKKTMSNPLINSDNFSRTRLSIIRASIQQKYDVYMGIGTQPFNSIYNHTRRKKKKLADEVKLDFENLILEGVELIDDYDTYFVQNPSKLVSYRTNIENLMLKFKIDVISALKLTATISDSDGD